MLSDWQLPGVSLCMTLSRPLLHFVSTLSSMRIILKSLSTEPPQWAQAILNRYPNACILQSITDPIPSPDHTPKPSTLILQDNLDLSFYAQFQKRDNVIHVLETFPHVSLSKFKKFKAIDEMDEMLKYIEENNLHKEVENSAQTNDHTSNALLLEDAAHSIAFQLGTLINATIKEPSQPVQFWQILERLLDTIVVKAIANDPLIFPSTTDEDQRAEMYDRLFGELAHFVTITASSSKSGRINTLLKSAIERFNNGRLGSNPEGERDSLRGKGYLQVTWRECPIKQLAHSSSNGNNSKVNEFLNALFAKQ